MMHFVSMSTDPLFSNQVLFFFLCFFSLLVCKGEIAKSDLEKLVKDKEAVELKAAEERQVLLSEGSSVETSRSQHDNLILARPV